MKSKNRFAPIVPDDVQFIVIDSFCGAGGYTEGAESAVNENGNRIAVVIIGINHDDKALASHKKNHPETIHFVEDVRDPTLPLRLVSILDKAKQLYPNAAVVFHASLECTNFSNAKGGMERDPDSRSLAEFMPGYLKVLNPDMFTVENVREFMKWGPMEPKEGKTKEGYPFSFLVPVFVGKGKKRQIISFKPHWVPIKKHYGIFFEQWKEKIKGMGYTYGHKLDNTADIGANTSRTRYFAIFSQDPEMRVWPEHTHAKNPDAISINGTKLKKWKPIRPCLRLDIKGKTIFRTPWLSEKTYERIFEGNIRHIGGGDRSFIKHFFGEDGKTFDISNPFDVSRIETGLSYDPFVMSYYSGTPECRVKSMNDPSLTLTTSNRIALVSAERIEGPTKMFCMKYYGTGANTFPITDPSGTLTTKDRNAIVEAHFIDLQYGQSKPVSIDEPAACITANPHLSLINAQFVMKTQFDGGFRDLTDPGFTITSSRHFDYIVTAERELRPTILIYEEDPLIIKKIKVFMAIYGITDILMRMLLTEELILIQGFPADYILVGSDSDKKKFIGNSIPPVYIKAWYETMGRKHRSLRKQIAA